MSGQHRLVNPRDIKNIDDVIMPVQSILTIGDGQTVTLYRFQLPSNTTYYVTVAQVIELGSATSPSGLNIRVYDNGAGSVVGSWSNTTPQFGDPLVESSANANLSIQIENSTGGQLDVSGFLNGRLVS